MVGQNLVNDARFKEFQILAPNRQELDLFNFISVKKYLAENHPDIIIHAAGRVGGIQANIALPVQFLIENLDINRNLILAAYETKVKKLINLGSSCMYPRNAKNPLHEEQILQGELEPTNEGYALAKIIGQRLCEYISRENKLYTYKTIIPCNLYGPYDKFDPKSSHLIPAIIKKIEEAIKSKQKQIEIWGDGTARREFMYVGELVDCLFRAINEYDSMPNTMNVGLGYDYSVNEYYQVAAKILGFGGGFSHDLSKPVGMKQKLTNIDLAHKWGWRSSLSLEDGLKKTYEYYKKIS